MTRMITCLVVISDRRLPILDSLGTQDLFFFVCYETHTSAYYAAYLLLLHLRLFHIELLVRAEEAGAGVLELGGVHGDFHLALGVDLHAIRQ